MTCTTFWGTAAPIQRVHMNTNHFILFHSISWKLMCMEVYLIHITINHFMLFKSMERKHLLFYKFISTPFLFACSIWLLHINYKFTFTGFAYLDFFQRLRAKKRSGNLYAQWYEQNWLLFFCCSASVQQERGRPESIKSLCACKCAWKFPAVKSLCSLLSFEVFLCVLYFASN